MLPYENKSLRELAKESKRCPMCSAPQPNGCIPAHCNDLEFRGMGLKSSDALVAFVCNDCHDLIDGRTRGMPKDEKRALWVKAFLRTMVWLWETGRIKVAK